MEAFLLIGGLVAFAFACRTVPNRYVIKLGSIAFLGATYAAGFYVAGHSHWAGMAAMLCWFLLPWIEILGHVRALRFPLANEVKHRYPPSRDLCPNLDELTDEIVAAGFEEVENAGWDWHDTHHFIRMFYHAPTKTQAAVNVAHEEGFASSSVSVTSRTTDGRTFSTANYPFSNSMKLSPAHKVLRFPDAEFFEDLVLAHRDFLVENGVKDEDLLALDVEKFSDYLESDMQSQIRHNIDVGVLEPVDEQKSILRYSWRGCFYLWFEFLKDLLRV